MTVELNLQIFSKLDYNMFGKILVKYSCTTSQYKRGAWLGSWRFEWGRSYLVRNASAPLEWCPKYLGQYSWRNLMSDQGLTSLTCLCTITWWLECTCTQAFSCGWWRVDKLIRRNSAEGRCSFNSIKGWSVFLFICVLFGRGPCKSALIDLVVWWITCDWLGWSRFAGFSRDSTDCAVLRISGNQHFGFTISSLGRSADLYQCQNAARTRTKCSSEADCRQKS